MVCHVAAVASFGVLSVGTELAPRAGAEHDHFFMPRRTLSLVFLRTNRCSEESTQKYDENVPLVLDSSATGPNHILTAVVDEQVKACHAPGKSLTGKFNSDFTGRKERPTSA